MEQEMEQVKDRVLLVGVNLNDDVDFLQSMEELGALAEACNMEVAGQVTQNLSAINKGLYIGTGKVREVRELAEELNVDIIIFDNALSPSQLRNLQKETEKPVMDRTSLILEIFSTRAKSREARLQVEVARLQYLLPRLVGLHDALSRQGGGSGFSNKGSGEKKLELDRRKIEYRLSELRKELEEVSKERDTQRKQRQNAGIARVALVGYTNAGKSTIMNIMVDEYMKEDTKKVLEKDMLFATLETTVRKITAHDSRSFLLSDTVGFISKLPHNLIKAFRSTLEEVKTADLLLHVIDFSDPHYKEHMRTTSETLKELEAGEIPVIYVYNKADLVPGYEELPKLEENGIYMSAKKRSGLKELTELIFRTVSGDHVECSMLIPFSEGAVVSYLTSHAEILSTEYTEEGTLLTVRCGQADYGKFKKFCV